MYPESIQQRVFSIDQPICFWNPKQPIYRDTGQRGIYALFDLSHAGLNQVDERYIRGI